MKTFTFLVTGKNGENFFEEFDKNRNFGEKINDEYISIVPSELYKKCRESVLPKFSKAFPYMEELFKHDVNHGCYAFTYEDDYCDKHTNVTYGVCSLFEKECEKDFTVTGREHIVVNCCNFGGSGYVSNGYKSGLLVTGHLEEKSLPRFYQAMKSIDFFKDVKILPYERFYDDTLDVLKGYEKFCNRKVDLSAPDKKSKNKYERK